MLDHAIAGLNAYAFHLSSNLWAGVVAGFVYLVALALTQHRTTAIAAAALFAVHPVHVEAIAWISSRKDLVAAAFVLPGFLAYLKYRQRGNVAWYIASLLLFLLALLGKLSVIALPVVLFSFDLFVEKRPFGRSIVDKIPFVLLAAIVAAAVQHAQPGTGAQPDMSMRAASFLEAMWLLTGFGNYVLYRVPPPVNGTALAQFAGAVFLLAIIHVPITATQALSRGHSVDLLDSLYVSANAGTTVLISGHGSLSVFAIGWSCHSDCMAGVQGHRSFAKMERDRRDGTPHRGQFGMVPENS